MKLIDEDVIQAIPIDIQSKSINNIDLLFVLYFIFKYIYSYLGKYVYYTYTNSFRCVYIVQGSSWIIQQF